MAANEGKARPVRVAAQLRQELARLVARELGDPRLEGLVISNVTMTGDLRIAKVFWRLAVAVAPGEALQKQLEQTQAALGRASGRLRKAAASNLQLRVVPELIVAYDAGQEQRDRIDQLLEEVRRESGGRT